jgi:DNA-binding PadR family transcriptional regulator
VDILHRDGYVTIVSTGPDSSIQLTDKGREVLARRPLGELLERINSR